MSIMLLVLAIVNVWGISKFQTGKEVVKPPTEDTKGKQQTFYQYR